MMDTVESTAVSRNEMIAMLAALTALKQGDSRVRLPLEWGGLSGKVAEAFNDVVELNERMAEELVRLSKTVGKQGKLQQRATLGDVRGFWKITIDGVNALIDDLVHPTSETARVIGAVAQGDLSQTMALEVDDRALEGEFLRTAKTINKMVDQLGLVRFRSDSRRARGRHRRQARRTGESEGRGRHLEGSHRLGELHGPQPDGPGAQHRGRDDRGGEGRPLEEDHGGRQGRVPGAEEHHQHDGGPATLVRARR
jgi:HAMP domain-containing protein